MTRALLYTTALTLLCAGVGYAQDLKPYDALKNTPGQQTNKAAKHVEKSEGDAETEIVCCPDKDAKSDAAFMALPEEIRRTAKPGQCFARLLKAPKIELQKENVQIAEASTTTQTIPAQSEIVTETYVVTPQRVEERLIPAQKDVVYETVVDTPETKREEVIPARYEMRTERVLVTPERKVWSVDPGIKTGAALMTAKTHQAVPYLLDGTLNWPGKQPLTIPVSEETADYLKDGSGQPVYCLKIIPAEYKTVTHRVEVEPARTRLIVVPATFKKVKRERLLEQERVEKIVHPAVLGTRKVTRIIKPEQVITKKIPAKFEERVVTRVASQPQPVWREVLCERNATPAVVTKIQKALAAQGYNPGALDGTLGSQTVRAMQKFSADNQLPQGQISMEAVKLLGVDVPL